MLVGRVCNVFLIVTISDVVIVMGSMLTAGLPYELCLAASCPPLMTSS